MDLERIHQPEIQINVPVGGAAQALQPVPQAVPNPVIVNIFGGDQEQPYILQVHTPEQREMLRFLNKNQVGHTGADLRRAVNILNTHGVHNLAELQPLLDAAQLQHNVRLAAAPLLLAGIAAGMAAVSMQMGPEALPVAATLAVGLATAFFALAPERSAPGLVASGAQAYRSLQQAVGGVSQQAFHAGSALQQGEMERRIESLKELAELATLPAATGKAFAAAGELVIRGGEILQAGLQASRSGVVAATTPMATLQNLALAVPALLLKATEAMKDKGAAVQALAQEAGRAFSAAGPRPDHPQVHDDVIDRVTSRNAPPLTSAQLFSLVGSYFRYLPAMGHKPEVRAAALKDSLSPGQWAALSAEIAAQPADHYAHVQGNFLVELASKIEQDGLGTESQRMAMLTPWLGHLDDARPHVQAAYLEALRGLGNRDYLTPAFKTEFRGHMADAFNAGQLTVGMANRLTTALG